MIFLGRKVCSLIIWGCFNGKFQDPNIFQANILRTSSVFDFFSVYLVVLERAAARSIEVDINNLCGHLE